MSLFTGNGLNDTADDSGLLTLEGTIEDITFHNEENGYTVATLAAGDDFITVVGIMPFAAEGETIKAMGKWETHAQYGRQFKLEYYEKQLPATQSAILKYLSSRAVKGIGPRLAERIVERFGEDSFDAIENHPEFLAELPGISQKKAAEISENFKEQFGIRSVMMFCRDFFGPATAVRVYKRWGGAAVDVIKENPYALCDEIYGIGFERADRIAHTLGVSDESQYRVHAGIKYFLSYNAQNNGHAYIPASKLREGSAQMLGVSSDLTAAGIDSLIQSGQLKEISLGGRRCIYLKEYYEAETYTTSKLILLDKLCQPADNRNAERLITTSELEDGIAYAAMQKKAIINSLNQGVMVLTGGPGTGKTTVIKAVLRIFDHLHLSVTLCAPTGRAAKRMSEATQREAKTIHRLLEMEYQNDNIPRFKRDENNRLAEDVVIVDEASMVDISLMSSLLKAIKPGARLILIGDSDQLPSVGAGNVLNDIIESGRFQTVKLKEIFRQASESMIITNAHSINHGEYPILNNNRSDFFYLRRDSDDDIAKTVVDLCLYRLPKKYGQEIRQNIQIISPSRKGAAGTAALNHMLQMALNPPAKNKREKKVRDIVFREGDRVMQVKNNYDIAWTKDDTEGVGVFNGDIGVIQTVDYNAEHITILFDDRTAIYDFTMLDELEHAYAVTVHKSQGSEYPIVIIPMYRFSPRLMTRNLLYTAVTRAQEMVILVGREDVINAMVDNNRQQIRYTGLRAMLENDEAES